ncbi:hypothetical protein ACFV0L_19745 [Streptosporangium canum]|uniref:hypothetical protein n=1 Tax=Streptosporangium canum TaxID=324952 RepID=UPI0036AA0114
MVTPFTTWEGVTWKAPAVGLGTSIVAVCQADHAEVVEAVALAARARQRIFQPSVSLPAGTLTVACPPDVTACEVPVQIWPVPS